MGGFVSTLLHETGHAIFYMLDIPIFGREEDAADAVAVVCCASVRQDRGAADLDRHGVCLARFRIVEPEDATPAASRTIRTSTAPMLSASTTRYAWRSAAIRLSGPIRSPISFRFFPETRRAQCPQGISPREEFVHALRAAACRSRADEENSVDGVAAKRRWHRYRSAYGVRPTPQPGPAGPGPLVPGPGRPPSPSPR